MTFIIAFIIFAIYDFVLAYGFHKEVPGLTIPTDISNKAFWKYQFIRFGIVTAICLIVYKILGL